MKYTVTIIMLLLVIAAGAAELTLNDARTQALENNPLLQSQRHSTSASNLDFYQSITNYLPQGSARASSTYPEEGLNSQSRSVDFSQTILNTNTIVGILNSNQSSKAADYTLQTTILSTLAQVDNLYYDVLRNEDLLKIAQDNLTYARNQLAIAQTRYQAGALSQADLLNVQSDMAAKDVALIQAQTNLEVSRQTLANYCGTAADATLQRLDMEDIEYESTAYAGFNSENTEAVITALQTYSAEHNPQLKLSQVSTAMAKNNYLGAYGAFVPSINLSYGTSWQKTELDDDFSDSSTLSLSASVPIFPLADTGLSIASKRHSLKSAQYNQTNTDQNVNLAIRQSYLNLTAAARSIASAKLSLNYAANLYRQNLVRFENNAISSTQLLDASLMLSNANQLYTSSIYSFLSSRTALMQQIGTMDVEELEQCIHN
jgi:outer membrane protein TolC